MNRRRFLVLLLAVVLIASLAQTLASAADKRADDASARIASVTPDRREAAEEVELLRAKRVTQEEREAAAERSKLKELLDPDPIVRSLEPTAGGVPDYFGDANWAFSPPLRKFVDSLPGLGADNKNNLDQYIPVATPDTITFPGSDYYEIELREYSERMHSDLPATRLRGYVQANNGTGAGGENNVAPEAIHYLGPIIVAQKDRPVRIKFTNALPTGDSGKLFLPVDTTVMGAGMGPLGMDAMPMNYTENRGVVHLHGGRSPWISDGTPHQWLTPADEMTPYKQGAGVANVPDMWYDPMTHQPVAEGTPDATTNPGPGSMTYFYSNQQSARFMFYHDHTLGITRLNVYAGEAAGYVIEDPEEERLIDENLIPGPEDTIPLVIQDKTFVDPDTIAQTDPTWNWGTTPPTPHEGDLWLPHVYSPAQNPYDEGGANPFGRWHYGPWFWPPTRDISHPPTENPYYDPNNMSVGPPEMPGTPNPSMAGEMFMDTPVVNGTAFPYVEVDPKAYRFRILNAADDRFWNLQLYEADPATESADHRLNTEVRMVPASVCATNFPEGWPTDGRDGGVPDPGTRGPNFVQFATESGFLASPAVLENKPITWNTDPTTFNFGNVDGGTLILGPAERADVVVDFSQHRGKTLIVYNDAPAAYPARDPRLDYYTGAPDLTDTGGHWGPQVGFGPNTRTIIQIRVRDVAPAPSFDTTALVEAFKSTDTTEGVFERGQDPILVAQSAYDSAYNTTFPTSWPDWGYARIQDNSMNIHTVTGTTLTLPLEPKAIQDEMGEAFDDYGRMEGKLGLELPNTQAGRQTFVLQKYMDPPTEFIKAEFTPMAPVANDGTQIWKITHNGVDTHPIHFHLFDVQLLNRVGWDGQIRRPDANELGWKDTVKVSPLEDTIVALRAVVPTAPFKLGDSIRLLDPTMPAGSTEGFTNIDPYTGDDMEGGETPDPDVNRLYNYGWEYMWHCHILSHEEMEMMRPIVMRVAPAAPTTLTATAAGASTVNLAWSNNATDPAATNVYIERATNAAFTSNVTTFTAEAAATTYADTTVEAATTYYYRVRAENQVAYSAWSNQAWATPTSQQTVAAPTNLTATAISGWRIRLNWKDNATNEDHYYVERRTGTAGAWIRLTTLRANTTTYTNGYRLVHGQRYSYRVRAGNRTIGYSAYSNVASAITRR
ncbi:MAG: hypothetical protein C4521_06355 [Actinobacteria bacterium]|nr:MAG: hypothetical protein C4521_06355 [Actinomycetota bacterium]